MKRWLPFLLLGLMACEFRKDKLDGWDASRVMGFTTLKSRVLDSRCGLDLTDYTQARLALVSIQQAVLVDRTMPPAAGALTDQERGWIRRWVQAGGPLEDQDFSEAPATPVDGAGDLLYQRVKATTFAPRCIRCHSVAGGDKGDINLENYANVLANLREVETAVLVDETMPPRGPLPDDEKAALRAWIDSVAAPAAKTGEAPKPGTE
jgi:uncharacterized membrane protein